MKIKSFKKKQATEQKKTSANLSVLFIKKQRPISFKKVIMSKRFTEKNVLMVYKHIKKVLNIINHQRNGN